MKSFNPPPRPLTAWMLWPADATHSTLIDQDEIIGVIVSEILHGGVHLRDAVEPAVVWNELIEPVAVYGKNLIGVYEAGQKPARMSVERAARDLSTVAPTDEEFAQAGIV